MPRFAPPQSRPFVEVGAELEKVYQTVITLEGVDLGLKKTHPRHRASAENLRHYLALRRRDLRPLQDQLAELGLSSLGRTEAHVLASLQAVRRALRAMAGETAKRDERTPPVDFAGGQERLRKNADALFGPALNERPTRIMVTMPSEAAMDFGLVKDLLACGMECMRINCAHDGPEAWRGMLSNLRRAEREAGKECRVLMDLGGPKLRTGTLPAGPAILKLKPKRDEFGRVLESAGVRLVATASSLAERGSPLPEVVVTRKWLRMVRTKAVIRFNDARSSERTLVVTNVAKTACIAGSAKTVYLAPGLSLTLEVRSKRFRRASGKVLEVPAVEGVIRLRPGDRLRVTRLAYREKSDSIPAVPCTLPTVFRDVRKGHSIWFDDGKIGGCIERVSRKEILVQVTRTGPKGQTLRADKGINLPDSTLRLGALTRKDRLDLKFAARYADIVGLSFANTASDVRALKRELDRSGGQLPGVMLKIETRRGFENLPELLLAAMELPKCGVMIARGDLAVECGFERLAEVQEEILWICEAAHVPVVWATQVLESLAKKGLPTRAEITDAAMGVRAECVMLNKGPEIVQAVKALDGILRRMRNHQSKKRSMLRKLSVAKRRSI